MIIIVIFISSAVIFIFAFDETKRLYLIVPRVFMRSCYGYEQLCYPINFANLLSSWTDIPQMTSISSHRRLPWQRRQNLGLELNIVSYSTVKKSVRNDLILIFFGKSESSIHRRRSLRNCYKGMGFLTCDGYENE